MRERELARLKGSLLPRKKKKGQVVGHLSLMWQISSSITRDQFSPFARSSSERKMRVRARRREERKRKKRKRGGRKERGKEERREKRRKERKERRGRKRKKEKGRGGRVIVPKIVLVNCKNHFAIKWLCNCECRTHRVSCLR
jgi:sRNA-binding protein